MARLVRPRGWVAVMDPDAALRVCCPPHPALEQLTELLAIAYRRDGFGPHPGRRLPYLLAAAGLVDIAVQARAEARPPGDAQRAMILELVQNIRATALAQGLSDVSEGDRLDRATSPHANGHETLALRLTYFLAWARKPASAG